MFVDYTMIVYMWWLLIHEFLILLNPTKASKCFKSGYSYQQRPQIKLQLHNYLSLIPRQDLQQCNCPFHSDINSCYLQVFAFEDIFSCIDFTMKTFSILPNLGSAAQHIPYVLRIASNSYSATWLLWKHSGMLKYVMGIVPSEFNTITFIML